jgi:rhodanese-related sulfurtransferase
MNILRVLTRVLALTFTLFLLSPGQGFAQDVVKKILSIEAYDMLNTLPDTYLIDVRTQAEYQFVGHPENAYLFPYRFWSSEFKQQNGEYGYTFDDENADFVREIGKVFQKTNTLLIICRDGTRSAPAAKALLNAGFKNIYDVTDGFEGAPFPTFDDPNNDKFYRQLAGRNKIHGMNHRRHYGWQWWGLPWTYEMDPSKIYPPDLSPKK